MILVDSSVWVDYFRGRITPRTESLDRLLGAEPLAVGDLMLTEVLQGFTSDRDFNSAQRMLANFAVVILGGSDVAEEAARNYRRLRARGVTVRKTTDMIIATRCIVSGYQLLHDDHDFDAFEKHLGLRCVS